MSDAESDTPKRVTGIRKLASSRDVRRACLKVANAVLRGDLQPNAANSVVYALSLAQRSIDTEVVEQRLAELEERAATVPGGRADVGTHITAH